MHATRRTAVRKPRTLLRSSVILALAAALSASAAAAATKATARGERIFTGREAVAARLDGHDGPLSPALGKCASCHQASPRNRLETNLAPPLDRGALLEARARRGGPPYAYSETSFCTTVRSGVDPQYVTMLRAMPRFDMTDEQCAALWSYLTEKRNEKQ
jgi:mono/diheme cytochrome c family protein